MRKKSVKVIFVTNVWISFLIGKCLSKIKEYISDSSIIIVITEQLITELKTVTSREKLRKYFPKNSVKELIELLETISEKIEITPTHYTCRDPKDNFLLDLIYFSQADFLVTGDMALLQLNPFKTAKILTPTAFIKQLKKLK